MEPEKIILEIPPKALHVSNAACPHGHSVMDPDVPISDYPSIKLVLQHGDLRETIHLDPVYGSFTNIFEVDIPEGAVINLFCPTCGVDLKIDESRSCEKCAAPLFQLSLPHGGMVEACLRIGCHQHRLQLVDVDAQAELLHRLNEIQLLM